MLVLKSRPDDAPPRLRLTPALGDHVFRADGLWLRLSRDEREGARGGQRTRERLTLQALSSRRDRLPDLVTAAVACHGRRVDERLRLWAADPRNDYWPRVGDVAPRPLASVITAGDVGTRLLDDARRFLGDAEWYRARGVPWRRGYLLHGPPGTGKTSLVKALAGELRLGLGLLDLTADGLTDGDLRSLMAAAPRRALILLEDVDAAFTGRERGEGGGTRLSFSGLLNAIDGAASQEGRLLVMTTNHPEKLDPALVRPGRVDVRAELGLFGSAEAALLFRRFFAEHPDAEELAAGFVSALEGRPVGPAALQGWLLLNRDTPERAVEDVGRLFGGAGATSEAEASREEVPDGREVSADAGETASAQAHAGAGRVFASGRASRSVVPVTSCPGFPPSGMIRAAHPRAIPPPCC